MTEEAEAKEDLVANRLTLVPALASYTVKNDASMVRGRLGVTASTITCAPKESDTEPSLGVWSATGTQLKVLVGSSDCGPRSGRSSKYEERVVGFGRHKMMVSREALLGVVEGRTAWGDSGEKARRIVAWRWSFDDIDEIRTGRLKKMFKMWDVDLVITSRDPHATLEYNGFGQEAHLFSAYDSKAKAAKRDGSNLLGFAHVLSQAIALHRNCRVTHTTTDDSREPSDVFTFM